MKPPLFILHLAAALLIPLSARCGDLQDEFEAAHSKPPEPSAKSRTSDQIEAKDPEITEVGIERAAWFYGDAAVYSVIIKSDGTFSFVGDKHTSHPGRHTGRVGSNELVTLFQYVREMDYFSLDDNYSPRATDQDLVFTMAAKNGHRKIVRNEGKAGPAKLWALEHMIDWLMQSALWDDPK